MLSSTYKSAQTPLAMRAQLNMGELACTNGWAAKTTARGSAATTIAWAEEMTR
jgi:hypothetical protein